MLILIKIEIRSTIICYHQSGTNPKEIALKFILPQQQTSLRSGKTLNLSQEKSTGMSQKLQIYSVSFEVSKYMRFNK